MSAIALDAWASEGATADAAQWTKLEADLCAARPKLMSYARHLTRNRYDAEDLVQTTMLLGLLHLPKFRGGSCILPWLFTIAKHRWFDETRARRRHHDLEKQWLVVEQAEQSSSEGDQELRELIERAGAQLSSDHAAVLLSFAVGMSYAQIAHRHGISEGTVKSRIHRAREQLQRSRT